MSDLQDQDVFDRIDLSLVEAGLVKEKPDWSQQRRSRAVMHYRMFLRLVGENPSMSLIPSADIDTVWHLHIAETDIYLDHLKDMYNCVLTHDTSYMGGDKAKYDKAVDSTRNVWREKYGSDLHPEFAPCRGFLYRPAA